MRATLHAPERPRVAGSTWSTMGVAARTLRRSIAARSMPTAGRAGDGGVATGLGHDFSRASIFPPTRNIIQTRLTIGEPGDSFEREADAVARRVVDEMQRKSPGVGGMPVRGDVARIDVQQMIQRVESSFPDDAASKLEDAKDQVQLKGGGTPAGPGLEQTLAGEAGNGRQLPAATQARMEQGFGVSFDRVRIHADARAADLSHQLRAEAFTQGNDVYFGAGKFDDRTRAGNELLAHELTHTLQQQGIRRKTIQRRGGATVGDLDVRTNVVSAGLTAGHAWLSYTPTGGSETTYGTWGNRIPIGLHRDLEVGFPHAAKRSTPLDASDLSRLASFASANNTWSYYNNCASFAARGWGDVTKEALAYTSFGIPNPSALGQGIIDANGGTTGVLSPTPAAAHGGGSSSSL